LYFLEKKARRALGGNLGSRGPWAWSENVAMAKCSYEQGNRFVCVAACRPSPRTMPAHACEMGDLRGGPLGWPMEVLLSASTPAAESCLGIYEVTGRQAVLGFYINRHGNPPWDSRAKTMRIRDVTKSFPGHRSCCSLARGATPCRRWEQQRPIKRNNVAKTMAASTYTLALQMPV